MSSNGQNLIEFVRDLQDVATFRSQHWEGSFAEYVEIVQATPKVARTAYQRLYDMIMSYGSESYTQFRDERGVSDSGP